jgi:hypothetical protein
MEELIMKKIEKLVQNIEDIRNGYKGNYYF